MSRPAKLTLAIYVFLLTLAAFGHHAPRNPVKTQPAPSEARQIALELRALANRIEGSHLPNKSDIAERVEEMSAEVENSK